MASLRDLVLGTGNEGRDASTVYQGPALEVLQTLASESVDCVVARPSWVEGHGGVREMREMFAELRRVLVKTGSVWLYLSDTASDRALAGTPWQIALALQADGWIVRNAVVLRHPVPPVSEQRRLAAVHDFVFLLVKQRQYYFDLDAVGRAGGAHEPRRRNPGDVWRASAEDGIGGASLKLALRCISATCPPGGTVLDPFFTTATTHIAAQRLGRSFVGVTPDAVRSAA